MAPLIRGSIFCFLILLGACQLIDSAAVSEVKTLATQQHHLRCQMAVLQLQARTMWDSVAAEMDENLPVEMPADERFNMLNVRNTALIQMFMVYDSLSPKVQHLVERAGVRDSLLSLSIKDINAQAQANARMLDSLLLTLEREQPETFKDLKKSLVEVEYRPCEE